MQDLVQRARRGDRDAFATLAAVSIDRMFALARHILQDHELARDAVQSALLDAWRDLPQLRDTNRFDAWLHRLLVRACYDEARKQRAFRARVRLLPMTTIQPDPAGEVIQHDELERAFKRLTIEQRAVVVLHFFAGFPLTEIAEVLGIPAGTARSRLHYALRTLRVAIEEDSGTVMVQGRPA